jgi:poly-D-alanine transfer protein DltD
VNAGTSHAKPHLIAATAALLLLALGVAGGWLWCSQLEARYVSALARDLSDAKLQGVALQRAAFTEAGSAGALRQFGIAARRAQYCGAILRGISIRISGFPVGKMGTGMLSMAQKIAAVGSCAQGRKVAYSLSPSLFFEPTIDPSYYSGNFSALQARQLTYSAYYELWAETRFCPPDAGLSVHSRRPLAAGIDPASSGQRQDA